MVNQSRREPILLPYTLQTWCGMVKNNGMPQYRAVQDFKNQPIFPPIEDEKPLHIPKITNFADYTQKTWTPSISNLAVHCIQQCRSPTLRHTNQDLMALSV